MDCRNPEDMDVNAAPIPNLAVPGDWIPAVHAGMTLVTEP